MMIMNGALVFATLAVVVLLGIFASVLHIRRFPVASGRTNGVLRKTHATSTLRRPKNVVAVTICPQGTQLKDLKRAPTSANIMYTSDSQLAGSAKQLGWQVVVTPYPIDHRHVAKYSNAPFKLFEVGLRFSGAIVMKVPHAQLSVEELMKSAAAHPEKITRVGDNVQVVWFETLEQRRNALSDSPEVVVNPPHQ
jgi:hypothetical protein